MLNVSCIFSIIFSSIIFQASLLSLLWILFQGDCLFPIYLVLWVSTLHFSFVLYFSVFSSFFFFLTWSTWSLLFPGSRAVLNFFLLVFILGGKCWLGGLCWFPIGVTCACVLITGSLACPSGGLGILLSPRCCFVGVVPYLHEFLMYLWES